MNRLLIIALLSPVCLAGCADRGASEASPEGLIVSGWDRYILGEYDSALKDFSRAAALAIPGSDTHLHALFGEATTHDLRRPTGNPARARECYKEVVALGPESTWAAWSLLGLARMEHLPPAGQDVNWAKARAAYEEVYDRFPEHDAGQEAFCYLQETYVLTGAPEDAARAAEALEHFVQTHPDSRYVEHAYMLLSDVYLLLDQPETRLRAMVRRMETREQDPFGYLDLAPLYWNVAVTAQYDVGDFDTARKYYRLLIDQYPKNRLVFGAKRAIEKMDELERSLRDESTRGEAPAPEGTAR